ncbi:39S ribosomal protein L54, mitochondrial [Erpetoichthys calabaricus]|uniref:39S ribosomal protein L54, mitochondrial n=1 Tax=Erpetoichthys calabaricus TaxID=27687 RepID=UPI0022343DD8|nr:39S ribosomal protein L54, mitochondrial [Erpetoichthys calabaricus]
MAAFTLLREVNVLTRLGARIGYVCRIQTRDYAKKPAKKPGADEQTPPKKQGGTENKKQPVPTSEEKNRKPTKSKGKGGAKDSMKGPEVCKDPVKLTSHAMGVNIFKDGQDPVLKASEEYPQWLFQLDLGPPKKLSELDPESIQYWRHIRKQNIWRANKLSKGKRL